MDLSRLKPAKGSVKRRKRIARGEGSGAGGTATRGHKGAQSRSGYSRRAGFEGGQMPLGRRVPKFGFKNRNRVAYRGINLDRLQKFVDEKGVDTIDPETMIQNGFASKNDKVKILGKGKLDAKINITAHAFSKTAVEAIEGKGGTVNRI
ncbi:MAG: 50S ribosomal protein L15 [Bacteroidales bacterium]